MKVRSGFVANSSSSCYILDLNDRWTKELLARLEQSGISEAVGLGRGTAWATGDRLIDYMNDLLGCEAKYGWVDGLGGWIQEWVDELGPGRILFVRESDEGMGGELPVELDAVIARSLACTEYH